MGGRNASVEGVGGMSLCCLHSNILFAEKEAMGGCTSLSIAKGMGVGVTELKVLLPPPLAGIWCGTSEWCWGCF